MMSRALTLAAFAGTLALAACGPLTPHRVIASAGGKPVNHLPKYQQDSLLRFGDWTLDPAALQRGNCQLLGNTADVLVTTDGRFTGNSIQLNLTFTVQLVRPPRAVLSSYPVDLPLEGMNRIYNVQLAYDPTTAAHFLQPDTYLIITYQPLNEPQQRQVSLATRGLVHGLAALGRTCPT